MGKNILPTLNAEVIKDRVRINLSELANGIYYFKVTSDKNSTIKKVVKS
ncbi:MAG: T9SS type A sorting domain-containing protein [Bacteroidetes bacterium]|nr:T9SS type A sorting domain-containing protein [Bacteroidota bacterium]